MGEIEWLYLVSYFRNKNMNIFIDTNWYYSQKFDFNSIQIVKLIKFCREYDVRIIVPKVQRIEIEKKIKDYSKEIETKHISNIRKIWLYKSMTNLHQGFLEKELKKSFKSFLQQKAIIGGDIKNIEINDIVKRYCECRPPFTPKKPKEFMDALIISVAINIDNELLVVSKDNGMKDYAKESSCQVFDDITSLLDHLFIFKNLLPSDLSEKAIEIWHQKEDEIKDSCKGLWVYADDVWESSLEIDELELEVENDIKLVGISGNCYTVAYFVKANYHITGTYVDDDCGMYDSEDEKFISFDSKEYKGEHEVTGYIIAEIEINPKDLSVLKWNLLDTEPIALETISIEDDYY